MFDRTSEVAGDPERRSRFQAPLGPGLAALLADADPATLSGFDLVHFLKATERLASWAASRQLAAVAELGGRHFDPTADDPLGPGTRRLDQPVNEFADVEIAAALRLSRQTAGNRLSVAVSLQRLPAVGEALASGWLDLTRVRAITDAVVGLDDDVAARVADEVLSRAGGQTAAQLRARLARIVIARNPAAAQERHERAVAERRVVLTPVADGMAELWALLPADSAVALYTAVTALADRAKSPGDTRRIDQRRADVLGDLAATVLDHHQLPTRHRRRAHLHVSLCATTALGLDDLPGELAGYGPIPASLARRIAADATWRRILTDPASGALLDYGTTTYSAPQALADHVLTRDGTCRGPGCRQAAARCDLDHRIPYPTGPTAAHNLHAVCRHHHRAKTHAGWTYTTDAHHNLTWTSPTGHVAATAAHCQHGGPSGPAHHARPAGSPPAGSPRAGPPPAGSAPPRSAPPGSAPPASPHAQSAPAGREPQGSPSVDDEVPPY